MTSTQDHTHHTRFRIPKTMWDAYGDLATREGTDRTALLLDHIRDDIRTRGTDPERAAVAQAEKELAERRSRKGGRPRSKPAADTPSSPGVDTPSDPV
jgi:hypothetical protein